MKKIMITVALLTTVPVMAVSKDAAEKETLWVIQLGDDDCLKWINKDGSEVIPVWSTESRVKRILKYLPEITQAKPLAIKLEDFCTDWFDNLNENGIGVGPNWAGKNISGTTFPIEDIISGIMATKNESKSNST